VSEPKRWEKTYTKPERSEMALHATLALGGNEDKVAVVCLRYEYTLRAKDVQFAELVELYNDLYDLSQTTVRKYKMLEATLKSKDVQIAALVMACLKFSKAHGYDHTTDITDAMVDPQDWAEFDAAIKEATQ